jgi:hypothetical protein
MLPAPLAAVAALISGLPRAAADPCIRRAGRAIAYAPDFSSVIPAKAGIHGRDRRGGWMDSGFRRNDDRREVKVALNAIAKCDRPARRAGTPTR